MRKLHTRSLPPHFLPGLQSIAKFSALAIALWLCTAGCKEAIEDSQQQYAYVSVPQAFLRDRVAAVYTKVGSLHNGDRVQVLGQDRRFLKVRSPAGIEGWIEERNLAGQDVYDGFTQLARSHAHDAAQAQGVTRADVNMHLTPARDSDRLFQLKEGAKIELLARTSTPRSATSSPPAKPIFRARTTAKPKSQAGRDAGKKSAPSWGQLLLAKIRRPRPAPPDSTVGEPQPNSAAPAPGIPSKASGVNPETLVPPGAPAEEAETPRPAPAPIAAPIEDWWLIRDSQGRVGWILARLIDVDIPLEVAQYAEGQRIVSAFVLTTVTDPGIDRTDKTVPYYLMLLTDNQDGMPYDYNQMRIFTWNMRKHRYETAYREHDLFGMLPVTVGKEEFGKDGLLPTFTLRLKDNTGGIEERNYKLNGVIVRRVLGPNEAPLDRAAVLHARRKGRRSRRQ